jgi:hypothetical protein
MYSVSLILETLTIVLNVGQLDNTRRSAIETSNAEGLEHHLEDFYRWPGLRGHQGHMRGESKMKCLVKAAAI